MYPLHKKILVGLLTAALTVPAASVATAQSSFASLSSGSATSNENHDSKTRQLKKLAEESNIRAGHTKNADAENLANNLVQRAMRGDIAYINNVHESTTYGPLTQRTVVRIPVEHVDYLISELPGHTPITVIAAPFGVAVGKDSGVKGQKEGF